MPVSVTRRVAAAPRLSLKRFDTTQWYLSQTVESSIRDFTRNYAVLRVLIAYGAPSGVRRTGPVRAEEDPFLPLGFNCAFPDRYNTRAGQVADWSNIIPLHEWFSRTIPVSPLSYIFATPWQVNPVLVAGGSKYVLRGACVTYSVRGDQRRETDANSSPFVAPCALFLRTEELRFRRELEDKYADESFLPS